MIWLFFLNLFLAIVYVALTGVFEIWNFVLGFVLGFVVIALYSRTIGSISYAGKFYRLGRFVVFFIRILVRANLQVAWEVITPGFSIRPRIVRYPVAGMSPVQITTLANAISLTPGTLASDIDEEGELLYVHCMYGRDREGVIRDLDELKRRLLSEVFE